MTSFRNILFTIGILLVGLVEARTVDELKVAYEVKLLALEKAYQADLEKLSSGYARALEQVQEKLQKAGRLEDVLKVVEEKKDLKLGKWPLGLLDDSAPADFLRLRKIYETSRIKADREHAEAVIDTADKMADLMVAQMKALTREGKITEAKKAKDLVEAIQVDEKINAAKELVRRVRLNQNAPIAYRLRRSGDDLEVLVRFDKSGKVSLDSPVENVTEITGGKKERGDTKAKVLGEFVGAKGYEADSFVSFESDMDRISPPLQAVNYELEPGVEIQGRKALRILMPVKATNPRVEWPGVLSPEGSSSRIKIDFHYLIPSENKKLKGFSFHYGLAAPIEKKVMDTTGRWVAESLETESMNDYDMLRLFAQHLNGGGKTFDGGNESIYLDDLKVSYLAFAAHVVETYKDGKVVERFTEEPTAQKAIALAGKLLLSQSN